MSRIKYNEDELISQNLLTGKRLSFSNTKIIRTKNRKIIYGKKIIVGCTLIFLCFTASMLLRKFKTNKNSHLYYVSGENDSSIAVIRKSSTKKLPNALIIGAKKSGTRALLEFIRIHPDVRAVGTELHFFDKNFNKGLAWYKDQMPRTFSGQITLEKTPSYFVSEDCPSRIFNYNQKVKLILIVRDPVHRAISDYIQTAVKSQKPLRSIDEAVFVDASRNEINKSRSLIRIGLYSEHYQKWLKYFNRNQICLIDGENLITNPASEIKKLQAFLGLKVIITDKHFYFNETKGFPCLKKGESRSVPHCLGPGKGRQHPDVANWLLKKLYDFYRPYNEKFYKLTGINFNWERFAPR